MASYTEIYMKFSRIILCFLLVANIDPLFSQQSIEDSTISMGLIEVTYRGGIPMGDWGDRFGYLSLGGVQGGYKWKSNFYLTTGVQVLFGDAVDEIDILREILDTSGLLIGNTGILTEYRLNAGGIMIPLTVGKVIPIFPGHNPNSGLYVELGGQYIRHRIGFQAYDDDVSQIVGDYKKGYDRLTAGFGLRESIGYSYYSSNGYINLSIGVDFSQNFTRGQRSIQFDTGEDFTGSFLDLMSGIRFSWTYPIYQRAPRTYYY